MNRIDYDVLQALKSLGVGDDLAEKAAIALGNAHNTEIGTLLARAEKNGDELLAARRDLSGLKFDLADIRVEAASLKGDVVAVRVDLAAIKGNVTIALWMLGLNIVILAVILDKIMLHG